MSAPTTIFADSFDIAECHCARRAKPVGHLAPMKVLDEIRARAERIASKRIPVQPVLCTGLLPELVYALVDPETPKVVRYIGRTNNPIHRYQKHGSVRDNVGVSEWFADLLAAGRAPMMLLVEQCTPDTVVEREALWIDYYRALGEADLNRSRTSNTLTTPVFAKPASE